MIPAKIWLQQSINFISLKAILVKMMKLRIVRVLSRAERMERQKKLLQSQR